MRVRLPIWRRGCGIRSRLSLAPAAFCSSFRTSCERLLDTRMADGVTRPGFFPQLEHCLGARSFDFDTPDLRITCVCRLYSPRTRNWATPFRMRGLLSLREEVVRGGSFRARCTDSGLVQTDGDRRPSRSTDGSRYPCLVPSGSCGRGLVFGSTACGGSREVGVLLAHAASSSAQRQWRLLGARSMLDARSFMISTLRSQVGFAAAVAHARLRLSRLELIGGSGRTRVARGLRLLRREVLQTEIQPDLYGAVQAGPSRERRGGLEAWS